jgi:hypothetical protein
MAKDSIMEILAISDLTYSKADNSTIDCIIHCDDSKSYPFTVTSYDTEQHGIDIWNDIQAGLHGPVAPYSPPTADQVAAQLVVSASFALSASDRTMDRVQEAICLGLTTPTAADVVAWVNYRRALRSIIATKSGTMPVKPAYPSGT